MSPIVTTKIKSLQPTQVPEFQAMCLELDPSLQASYKSIFFHVKQLELNHVEPKQNEMKNIFPPLLS